MEKRKELAIYGNLSVDADLINKITKSVFLQDFGYNTSLK